MESFFSSLKTKADVFDYIERFCNPERWHSTIGYWTNACKTYAIKDQCTTGKERRITRWEHEHVLETVQQRLDQEPHAKRRRRETVEHPFGTLKMRMGDALPDEDAAEGRERDGAQPARLQSDARHDIVGTRALLAAIRA